MIRLSLLELPGPLAYGKSSHNPRLLWVNVLGTFLPELTGQQKLFGPLEQMKHAKQFTTSGILGLSP